jgi:hypothetical protein
VRVTPIRPELRALLVKQLGAALATRWRKEHQPREAEPSDERRPENESARREPGAA